MLKHAKGQNVLDIISRAGRVTIRQKVPARPLGLRQRMFLRGMQIQEAMHNNPILKEIDLNSAAIKAEAIIKKVLT